MIAALCGHGPDRCFRGAFQGANIYWVCLSFPIASSVWTVLRATLEGVASSISEQHKRIVLPGGGAITVKSAVSKKGQALIGDIRGLDGAVLDEAAKFHRDVWAKYLRPALSDRKGWSFWASTPEGHNHFKDAYDRGQKADSNSEWKSWAEPSTANPYFDPMEIQKSIEDGMDAATVDQEYYARWVLTGTSRTYEFSREVHQKEYELDPRLPLDVCVSFKVAPPAWVITQGAGTVEQPDRAIDEITPRDSAATLRTTVEEFKRRYPQYATGRNVRIWGDATEHAKGTGYSDTDLLRVLLPQAQNRVRESNPPPEKDLVTALNLVLHDPAGNVRGYVSEKCIKLTRDLEFMRNREASYKADNSTPGLGHHAMAWAHKQFWLHPISHYRTPEPRPPDDVVFG